MKIKDLVRMIEQGKDVYSVTLTRVVAKYFGKEHKDVLRAIRNLECSEEFNERNYTLIFYVDKHNEKRREYEMTRDGFNFLVMGFTGKEAAAFKEAFIGAFNKMEKYIL